jgi:hypothetical protein
MQYPTPDAKAHTYLHMLTTDKHKLTSLDMPACSCCPTRS